ncbi:MULTISPECIES: hypothetical protein [Methylobacterium]|uniref:hypothetical protein n=1 Tax=Methylobacterium TaxID=407 RepID=UPI000FE141B4|nr:MULTISPECIES: hypothetical protein [Methylobacterium]MBN4096673.1 hypothetical protein [Methylobacterium sp. OT2]UIN36334.1 hypothetical protein LXM90_07500 [Methylobacterium oryzae]
MPRKTQVGLHHYVIEGLPGDRAHRSEIREDTREAAFRGIAVGEGVQFSAKPPEAGGIDLAKVDLVPPRSEGGVLKQHDSRLHGPERSEPAGRDEPAGGGSDMAPHDVPVAGQISRPNVYESKRSLPVGLT